jgi:hypothetical protein
MVAAAALVPLLALAACDNDCTQGSTLAGARSLDATHVELALTCSAPSTRSADFVVGNYRQAPPAMLAVTASHGQGRTIRLDTAAQSGGAEYTVRFRGESANFVGLGPALLANVTFRVDDRYYQSLTQVRLLLTADPRTGAYSRTENAIVALARQDHVFEVTVPIAVDPLRTIDTSDDRLGPEHVAYAVRAVDAVTSAPLTNLVAFEVRTRTATTVDLPLLSVPPPPPPEGLVHVTFDVDDSKAHALRAPVLKASIDSRGAFDSSFSTTILLAAGTDGHYSAQTKVRIDPKRVAGGTTSDTVPYTFYLSDRGTDYPNLSAAVTAAQEGTTTATINVGNPALVAVTFRVDISRAYLSLDGTQRGKFPSESVFLTGQWNIAEDAYGHNASDAFTGGENLVLEMTERPDHPGVWTRTLFLPPNRPYGWKVVRCPVGQGCAQLNAHVISSGQAFATVMKNLTDQNLDAATHPEVRVIDPRNPGAYKDAHVYKGAAMGNEPNPAGVPSPTVMFKQEAPDLVVSVGTDPVVTPVYVVGTWRDVNMPERPPEIVASNQAFNLNPFDYEAGFIGGSPPTYDLPNTPPIELAPTDGVLDAVAKPVAPGIYVALVGTTLYVATDPPVPGKDRFLIVSPTAPGAGPYPAMWGKHGTLPLDGSALFLAGEADNNYASWFHYGAASGVDQAFDSPFGRGAVLEGTLDLTTIGLPGHVWIAALGYDTPNGGALDPALQRPPGNGDANLDPAEMIDVDLAGF